ncbi:MAG: pantoate--beta-alanine ligase [Flavobacteriaceae bacterium]
MRSFNHSSEILRLLKKKEYRSLGLVPTMGSLHEGHTKLIEKCSMECDETIVSIFLNPTQFTNKIDLVNYPQSIKKDIQIIKKVNKNAIIYTPVVSDLYSSPVKAEVFDLDGIDKIIEGKFRKGHFQGVATVVKRLFKKFSPDFAFFGEKDYQQILVIEKLIKKYDLKVKIKSVLTVREENGLAMSSRNFLLDKETRYDAKIIYESLCIAKKMIKTNDISQIKFFIGELFLMTKKFDLEYFCIVENRSLKEVKSFNSKLKLRAFISVKAKGVRLIDNIALF